MKRLIGGILSLGCILCVSAGSRPAQSQTQDLFLGVNAAIASKSVEQQNAILAQLQAAGIHYIRSGILPDDKGVDFAVRAQAQSIRIDWLVQLQYRPGAPSRPWPNAFGAWGGPPLSAADPDEFRKHFEPLLAKLEAAGVRLGGTWCSTKLQRLPAPRGWTRSAQPRPSISCAPTVVPQFTA